MHPETKLTDYMYQEKREQEDSDDTSIQWLEDNIGKHEGGLFTAIRNDIDNMMGQQEWQ